MSRHIHTTGRPLFIKHALVYGEARTHEHTVVACTGSGKRAREGGIGRGFTCSGAVTGDESSSSSELSPALSSLGCSSFSSMVALSASSERLRRGGPVTGSSSDSCSSRSDRLGLGGSLGDFARSESI